MAVDTTTLEQSEEVLKPEDFVPDPAVDTDPENELVVNEEKEDGE